MLRHKLLHQTITNPFLIRRKPSHTYSQKTVTCRRVNRIWFWGRLGVHIDDHLDDTRLESVDEPSLMAIIWLTSYHCTPAPVLLQHHPESEAAAFSLWTCSTCTHGSLTNLFLRAASRPISSPSSILPAPPCLSGFFTSDLQCPSHKNQHLSWRQSSVSINLVQ